MISSTPCVNGGGKNWPYWFDTYTQGIGAFPARINLFDQAAPTKGEHLTNNPEGGRLPAGHSMTILGVAIIPVSSSLADFNVFSQIYTLKMEIDGNLILPIKPFHAPAMGGPFTDAAISNGVPSASSVVMFRPSQQLGLVAGQRFSIYFQQGTAGAAAAAFWLNLSWIVEWTQP